MNDVPTPAVPGSTPRPSPTPTVTSPPKRDGVHLGPIRVTLPLVLVVLVLIASTVYIGWVVLNVQDDQIPLLAVGFVAMGAAFVALAVGSLVGVWRAASRARGGRAFVLAMVGGLAGLGAIGAFTVTALLMMVWTS